MKHFSELNSQLLTSIENLYKVFERPLPIGPLSCLDWPEDEQRLKLLSTPLRELSEDQLRPLEFYDETWDSWGNESEVKYFLPRIAEFIAHYPEEIGYSSYLSIFKYKMADLYDNSYLKWTKEETVALQEYLLKLFEFIVLNSTDTEPILHILYHIVDNMRPYLALWEKVPKDLKAKQIESWLEGNIDPTLWIRIDYAFFGKPNNWSHNWSQVFKWIISDENIINIDIFYQDPWWKLACSPNIDISFKRKVE